MLLTRQYKVVSVGANKQDTVVILQGTHERFQLAVSDEEADALRPLAGHHVRLVLEARISSSMPPRAPSGS
jgi:hypothetical protein